MGAEPTGPAGDVELRPATGDDADAIAAVLLRTRTEAAAAAVMPPAVHPASDMIRHVREHLLGRREVWVAQVAAAGAVADTDQPSELVAVMTLAESWLDDLYVLPGHAGRGIGSALLDLARALRPAGFDLWVFEVNTPAQRFYERHGLVELERTDGSGNVEGAPDRRYRWRGHRTGSASSRGEVSVPAATVALT